MQVSKNVFDKNDQLVLEEGVIIGPAEIMALKNRDIKADAVEVAPPLPAKLRNDLFECLAGELLLELDYPGKLTLNTAIGETISGETLNEFRKGNMCPSFYIKRTFRGAPFDILAPMADPTGYEVVLPAREKFTLGILESLLRSGFHPYPMLKGLRTQTAINAGRTQLVPRRTVLTESLVNRLAAAALGGGMMPKRNQTCPATVVAPDNTVIAFRGERGAPALISRIKERSLHATQPSILGLLEGRPAPLPIVKITGLREELRPKHLLTMFKCPGFDITLMYRHFGLNELSHWFDPFLPLLLKEFGGGRVLQKSGSAFDPNNPLRKYHGIVKLRLAGEVPPASGKRVSAADRSSAARANSGKPALTPLQITRRAGGRFVAFMCIIETKRKIPTVFYHTTLADDVPLAKQVLNKVSQQLNLEGGISIQEGRLL